MSIHEPHPEVKGKQHRLLLVGNFLKIFKEIKDNIIGRKKRTKTDQYMCVLLTCTNFTHINGLIDRQDKFCLNVCEI